MKKIIIDNNIPVIVETSTWVMDCTNAKLVQTCREFLPIIDDLQQECPDQHAAELEDMYNRIEVFARNITSESIIVVKLRNELRLTFKYIMQLCCLYDHQPC